MMKLEFADHEEVVKAMVLEPLFVKNLMNLFELLLLLLDYFAELRNQGYAE